MNRITVKEVLEKDIEKDIEKQTVDRDELVIHILDECEPDSEQYWSRVEDLRYLDIKIAEHEGLVKLVEKLREKSDLYNLGYISAAYAYKNLFPTGEESLWRMVKNILIDESIKKSYTFLVSSRICQKFDLGFYYARFKSQIVVNKESLTVSPDENFNINTFLTFIGEAKIEVNYD